MALPPQTETLPVGLPPFRLSSALINRGTHWDILASAVNSQMDIIINDISTLSFSHLTPKEQHDLYISIAVYFSDMTSSILNKSVKTLLFVLSYILRQASKLDDPKSLLFNKMRIVVTKHINSLSKTLIELLLDANGVSGQFRPAAIVAIQRALRQGTAKTAVHLRGSKAAPDDNVLSPQDSERNGAKILLSLNTKLPHLRPAESDSSKQPSDTQIDNNNDSHWPKELYEESPECGKYNGIVRYLERVWLPITRSGIEVDRITLGEKDPSAGKAVENYINRHGSLPPHLSFPTRKEIKAARLSDKIVKDEKRLLKAMRTQAHQIKEGKARKLAL